MHLLPKSFYLRPTTRVARALLGKTLCVRTDRGIQRARIVETEAYLGVKDRAAHSFGDRNTPRTSAMYLEGGHAYVYFIYGMHFCLNVVTREAGCPEAVLIRAVEPLVPGGPAAPKRAVLQTNGPGKLCRHYGITREQNGVPLTKRTSPIWLEEAPPGSPRERIEKSARIGIDSAGEARDLLLRFTLAGNPYVSRRANPPLALRTRLP